MYLRGLLLEEEFWALLHGNNGFTRNLIRTPHALRALVLGIVNEVSCASLYHYTQRESQIYTLLT